jgi:hypothetical protein
MSRSGCSLEISLGRSSELSPLITGATHWVFAAGLTLIFPIAIANFDAGYMFGFFALMMIVQIIWCAFMMPETKGRTLEEIGAALSSK